MAPLIGEIREALPQPGGKPAGPRQRSENRWGVVDHGPIKDLILDAPSRFVNRSIQVRYPH
jgi:hypothetical protein